MIEFSEAAECVKNVLKYSQERYYTHTIKQHERT